MPQSAGQSVVRRRWHHGPGDRVRASSPGPTSLGAPGYTPMSAANLPHLMTVAEFLAWETPDRSDRWELIDGVPEAMAPASDRHGRIHAEVARLIGNHLAEHRPECNVIV